MPKKTVAIDPIKVISLAMKNVKCFDDWEAITRANSAENTAEASKLLTPDEHETLDYAIANTEKPLTAELLAGKFEDCVTHIQLVHLKEQAGEDLARQAWKLLPVDERSRLKALCPEKVESRVKSVTPIDNKPKPATLAELTAEVLFIEQHLQDLDGNDLDPAIVQLVDDLLNQKEETEEKVLNKLNSYCYLIKARESWADLRKKEAERLAALAEQDKKAVDFLKERLKKHLESTDQKQIRTASFNISVCQNGGKAPLRFDDTKPEDMPQQFQRIRVEPDKEKIREAIEAGEDISFAFIAERESHLRIK